MQRVAFLGVGKMGRPMAARLLKAGFQVAVYNRHPEKTQALIEQGARGALTIADAVHGAEVIITMLSDDRAVREVVLGKDGVLEHATVGQILVNMSTVSPDVNRELARAAGPHGVKTLDAPVSGSVQPAEAGKLTIMVGGDKEVMDQCLPVLKTMGESVFYLGPHGAGAHMKLCINVMLGAVVQALGEATVLAEKGGLERRQFLEVLGASVLRSTFTDGKSMALAARDYTTTFPLKHMAKDLGLIVAQAQRLQAVLPMAAIGHETFKAAANSGLADLDLAAVVMLLERASGLTPEE